MDHVKRRLSNTAGDCRRERAHARRPANSGASGPVPGAMQPLSSAVTLLLSADSGARPDSSPTTGYSTYPTSAAGPGTRAVR